MTWSREARQAVIRGAPALLGLLIAPFAPSVAPGIVFFALIGCALSLLDLALDGRGFELKRGIILTLASISLYVIAALQAVYAAGVVTTGSFQGGLTDLSDFAHAVKPEWIVLAASAGQAHAAVILASAVPARLWVRTPFDELTFIVACAAVTGFAIARFTGSDDPGVYVVIAIFYTAATLALCVPIYALTIICDWIEQALWRRARLEESSLPEPS